MRKGATTMPCRHVAAALGAAVLLAGPAVASTLTIQATGDAEGNGLFGDASNFVLTFSIDTSEEDPTSELNGLFFGANFWNTSVNQSMSVTLELLDDAGSTIGDVLFADALNGDVTMRIGNGSFGQQFGFGDQKTFVGNGTSYGNGGPQFAVLPAGTYDHAGYDLADWDEDDNYVGAPLATAGFGAWNDGGGFNNFDLLTFDSVTFTAETQVIPLPAAATMGLAGLVGVGVMRRRRCAAD